MSDSNLKKKQKENKLFRDKLAKQEHFMLDLVNLIIGFAVIIFAILAMLGYGGLWTHALVFLLGAVMMFLNMVKNIRRKSPLAIAFGLFGVVMTAVLAGILYYAFR